MEELHFYRHHHFFWELLILWGIIIFLPLVSIDQTLWILLGLTFVWVFLAWILDYLLIKKQEVVLSNEKLSLVKCAYKYYWDESLFPKLKNEETILLDDIKSVNLEWYRGWRIIIVKKDESEEIFYGGHFKHKDIAKIYTILNKEDDIEKKSQETKKRLVRHAFKKNLKSIIIGILVGLVISTIKHGGLL